MKTAVRGEILHLVDDPVQVGEENSYEYIADGLLIVEDGLIQAIGDAESLITTLPEGMPVKHYANALIMPGFVDCHVHYPQTEMIASYGEQLLGWLEAYAFPTERKFEDINHASDIASFFLEQLLANGTTTAMVFGTVHPQSVDAFFQQAESRNLRMICGKVLMDRNAPAYLQDTAQQGYDDSKRLIEQWHGRGRLSYAVTPRFAPTSTDEQLSKASELLQEFPDVYLQTHIAENVDELAWVKQLYPDDADYLSVYDRFGLLGKRSVLAHGIHLSDDECEQLKQRNSAIAFCPTSNLFIGSGLYNLQQAEKINYKLGFGTDVGGGTSFSLLQTMSEAYKVQQLRGHRLTALKSFYLATLGGARALDLDGVIGNFALGKEADFIVLDYQSTPLIAKRMEVCKNFLEKLFVLATLGDDRSVKATYILGEKVS